jgi:hypothetical protein
MKSLAKLSGPDLPSWVEFTHPNIWERQQCSVWSRLLIGAREREIALILDLCREFKGPFGVLYVLLLSHLGPSSGRYQNPEPIDYNELELFLYTLQEFFEQDGRHHLWVMSLAGEGQFIFANHNMIYAYGDLDRYEARLLARGFSQGSVRIPVPHSHNYHIEFDRSEDEVMNYWEWKKFPLEPDDDPY